jgi:drug/metabolite transporter (DMT)-like permease
MLGGGIILSVFVFFYLGKEALFLPEFSIEKANYDLLWISILVLVCTNFTFYLGAHSLQQLSAFTANLSVNLEPVYGIILGAIIFHENEQLNGWFYFGASLILMAIFLQSFLEYYKRRNRNSDNTELSIRE